MRWLEKEADGLEDIPPCAQTSALTLVALTILVAIGWYVVMWVLVNN